MTQTQAGKAPLGRTLGLVAPTAAEYRLLGANEPLLAAIRAATGGRELETPAAPWVHDLETTSQFTELWPWLLVLALLLWPLDIALRRVSLGRRELADGRRWVTDRVRGRRVAPRTQPVEGLFAARNRAGASGARSAILREATDGSATTATAQAGASPTDPATVTPTAAPTPSAATGAAPAPRPASTPPSRVPPGPATPTPPATATPAASPPAASTPTPPPPAASPDDTLARLREAKARRRS